MKLKRLKHVRKVLNFYQRNFSFKPPLKIVIDGTFCKASLKFKVNISEQLPKYLACEVKLFTTKCAIAECEALGPLLYGPFKVLQQFSIQPCSHDPPIPASNCLLTLTRKQNEHRFCVATQDIELSDRVRLRAGVPLLFIAYNAITLETPSEASRKRADRKLQDNIAPKNFHKTVLDKLKMETLGTTKTTAPIKRRKIKGPNPLSCKKKTKQKLSTASTSGAKAKKQRKKKKKVQTFTSVLSVGSVNV